MVKYKDLPPDVYQSIKRSLAGNFVLTHYPAFHDSMLDSFEIVSLDGKISVFYHLDGGLEIEGSDDNPAFRRIVKMVNGMVSKKDYI
ncbi:MAG: hypothetical protein KGI33_03940 [Thaumarchaeota archaeon]|nr:hypothetical protein [Nitrososphaerota archaeon]